MKATIVVARGTKMGRLYLTNSCVDLEAVEEAKTNPILWPTSWDKRLKVVASKGLLQLYSR